MLGLCKHSCFHLFRPLLSTELHTWVSKKQIKTLLSAKMWKWPVEEGGRERGGITVKGYFKLHAWFLPGDTYTQELLL